jgi:signal transduction histidine kinase
MGITDKQQLMKIIILQLLLIIQLGIPSEINAQKYPDQGAPFIQLYMVKDYGGTAQVWCSVQDNRGVMYFGDDTGILEFDGKTWNRIPVSDNSAVHSIAKDNLGKIYVGAYNEFGYLQPDIQGAMQYISLSETLDLQGRIFNDIQKIFITKQGIYFISPQVIFRYFKNKIEVTHVGLTDEIGVSINDSLLLIQRSEGICYLNDTILMPLGNPANIKKIPLSIISYPGNKILAAFEGELALFNISTKEFEKFETPAHNYFLSNKISFLSKLDDTKFAVATQAGGIVILSNSGEIIQVINKERGLFDGWVYNIYSDNTANLWASMSKGIAKIDINFPAVKFNSRQNVNGYVLTTSVLNKKRYIGTFDGLSYLPEYKINPVDDNQKFVAINSYKGSCWDLLRINSILYAVGSKGVFVIRDTTARCILPVTSDETFLCISGNKKFSDILFLGMSGKMGYIRIDENADIKAIRVLDYFIFPEIKENILKITPDKDGNLWVNTRYEGIYFIRFADNVNNYKITHFRKMDGQAGIEDLRTYNIDNEIYITSNKGVLKPEFPSPDSADSLMQFRYSSIFGDKIKEPLLQILKLDENKYLFHGKSFFYVTKTGNDFKFDSSGFKRLTYSHEIYLAFANEDKSLSIGASDAYFLYNPNITRDFSTPFNTLIRKVVVGKDSILFNGSFYNTSDTAKIVTINQTPEFKPVVDYNHNSVIIDFAGLFYEEPQETKFQYKLEGFVNEWSNWNKEYKASYTNLPEGNYTFKVKAKNIYGTESNIAEYSFKILTPWQRTWWAYSMYFILFLFIFISIVRFYTKRLVKQKEKLEKNVSDRTKELAEKVQELNKSDVVMHEMVEALNKTTDELKVERLKMDAANKELEAFSFSVSHDLRAPLRAISGFARILREDHTSSLDTEGIRILNIISANTSRMNKLIDDLLSFSRFSRQEMQVSLIDMFSLADSVYKEIVTEYSKEKFEFHLEALPEAYGDPSLMRQVWFNLISNAVKYSSRVPHPEIEVGYKTGNTEIIYYVKDNGAGFDMANSNRLFGVFQRLHSDKEFEGTGIGLANVKRILLRFNGRVWAEGRINGGATFYFALPAQISNN